MKKILFLLVMFPMVWACQEGNYTNKSIIEPISVKEMAKITKEYPKFPDLYDSYMDGISLTKADSAKYSEITYSRLIEFYEKQQSIDVHEYTVKHKKIYESYQSKVDSIVDLWIKSKSVNHDSIKSIYPDYKRLIETRKDWGNEISRLGYAIQRMNFIGQVIDDKYPILIRQGECVAIRELVEKDSLCYNLFLKTKEAGLFKKSFEREWDMVKDK